jgi:starch synthase
MDVKKVLYISQEIAPYLPATVMSELCRQIPQGIQEQRGFEVRTFMPKYGSINERRNQLHEVIRLSGLNLVIDDTDHPLIIKVATLQPARMQVYFIDSEDYFSRHLTDELEINSDPAENDERIMFFVRGVVETAKKLRWEPAIIHCSGWVTALAPLYLKRHYANDPTMKDAKVVYSLFDNKFDGTMDARMAEKLKMEGLTDDDLAAIKDGPADYIALNKLAIDHADAIVQAVEGVDAELIEYAKQSGKPFMEYPGAEDYIQKYKEFYESL